MKKKIYISGPMTGLPNLNRPAFAKAEKKLQKQYRVLNPARIPEKAGKDYGYYLTKAIRMLLKAQVICMLPGWQRSKGAFCERVLAGSLGMEIIEI